MFVCYPSDGFLKYIIKRAILSFRTQGEQLMSMKMTKCFYAKLIELFETSVPF